ncbi:hypothetical protein [Flavobacterium lipolyticum]|uniref:Uncharacterized protein n=1 Tax=Flavobacterium lipolyticum TaxID=2893754 RepID=A0ABS8LVH1_9FLAO|nr:hypothetical protein [Flavobacterium sp. F-126]MCC9016399.1 hypothetical protein [Flavobacterium sp. F-126]
MLSWYSKSLKNNIKEMNDDEVIFSSFWPSQGQVGTTITFSANNNPYKENIRPGSMDIYEVTFISPSLPSVVADSGVIIDEYSRFSVRVPAGVVVGGRYGIIFTLKKTNGLGAQELFFFRTSSYQPSFTVL